MNETDTVLIRGTIRASDGLRFWGFAKSGTERWVTQSRFAELESCCQEAEERKRQIERNEQEKRAERVASYRPKTKEEKAADRRQYMKSRRQCDTKFRTADRVRSRLRSALAGHRARKDEGINAEEILNWFRWLQKSGHAPKWPSPDVHLDHVIPIWAFDLTKNEARSAINNWRNLMPATAKRNLEKRNKIDAEEIRRVWRLADQYVLEMKSGKMPVSPA